MAEKKESTPKFLVVRSVEAGRGRSGFQFDRNQKLVDVKAHGLTDDEVAAIQNDPYLVAVEVGSKGDLPLAERRKADGTTINPLVGQGYETATQEQQDAREAGEDIPLHPSATGNVSTTSVEGEITRAKGTLRDLEPTALNEKATGDKKSSK